MSRKIAYPARWMVGGWNFYQVEGYGDTPLYAFTTMPETWLDDGTVKIGELYLTLEHAMVAAVGEKYTGPRTAGGAAVGTAADWFMRSIGAFDPSREELIAKAADDDRLKIMAEDAWNETPEMIAETVIDALGLGRKP